MGSLFYGARQYKVDDRLLAHFQVLISLKLRRDENFFLSWSKGASEGGGRHSIWIDNGVPIACEYDGSRPAAIQREWVEAMAEAAGSSLGLHVTDDGEFQPL
ncbi:MAG TPA: hypothetical protein VNT53_11235 [Pseudolysinimonas sp.]|nr:hypothetical protein [Pseudolysinimonas sp.]